MSFELSKPLEDLTHHLFSLPQEGPSPFSVVISGGSVGRDETLATVAQRLISGMAESLNEYRFHKQTAGTVGGKESLTIEYSWVQNGQRLLQRQIILLHDTPDNQWRLSQITVSTSDEVFAPEHLTMLSQIITTLKLRGASD
jgi:hypothetical protein